MTAVETKPRLNFAPVSGAHSTLLRIAAGWFIVNGAFYALMTLVGIAALLVGDLEFLHGPPAVIRFATQLMAAVGLLWTGVLLGRGRRLGAFLALFFLLLPLAGLPWQPPSADAIFWGVLGLIVVAVVWRELK